MPALRASLMAAIEANALSTTETIQFNFLEQATKSNVSKEAKAATVKVYRKLYASAIYKVLKQNTKGNI